MNIRVRCGELCVTLYFEGLGVESRLENNLRFSLFKREVVRSVAEISRTISGAILLLPHTYSCRGQEDPLHLPFYM